MGDMISPIKVEFDRSGIAYIEWYCYPDDAEHYFLRLVRWEEDTAWREVCIKIKKSELREMRDAIDETLKKGKD